MLQGSLGRICWKRRTSELTGRGKRKDETEMVAARVRKRTAMPNRGVAARLGMGHEVGVTRAVRRFRDDGKLTKRLNALEKKIGP